MELYTLHELGVEPGDKVECWNGYYNGTVFEIDDGWEEWLAVDACWWRMVQRVNRDEKLVWGEWKVADELPEGDISDFRYEKLPDGKIVYQKRVVVKKETVSFGATWGYSGELVCGGVENGDDYLITIDVYDKEVDVNSIKMVKLEKEEDR